MFLQASYDEKVDVLKCKLDLFVIVPFCRQDFLDVTGAERLEDTGLERPPETRRVVTLEEITSAEVEAAWRVHSNLFTTLTRAYWLEGQGQRLMTPDLLSPTLLSYQLGAELVKRHYHLLGE